MHPLLEHARSLLSSMAQCDTLLGYLLSTGLGSVYVAHHSTPSLLSMPACAITLLGLASGRVQPLCYLGYKLARRPQGVRAIVPRNELEASGRAASRGLVLFLLFAAHFVLYVLVAVHSMWTSALPHNVATKREVGDVRTAILEVVLAQLCGFVCVVLVREILLLNAIPWLDGVLVFGHVVMRWNCMVVFVKTMYFRMSLSGVLQSTTDAELRALFACHADTSYETV